MRGRHAPLVPVCGLLVGLVAFLAMGCGGSDSLTIKVSPETATLDTPFTVRVSGAGAADELTITVVGRSRAGREWRAVRPIRADGAGTAEVRDQYFLAELRPVAAVPEDDYLPWEQTLEFTATDGDAFATQSARRFAHSEDVSIRELRVRGAGFRGRWWVPRAAHRRTTIMLLGGSSGGLAGRLLASVLASHGYPVLELAYFGERGLPENLARIPLEYFAGALAWLRRQPAADPARVVAFGVSRGGELALLLGSTYTAQIQAVVGYVPSSLITPAIGDPSQPAWTLHGGSLPSISIPVDRIAGPVFVVGAGQDALWPSALSVKDVRRKFATAARRDVTALVYSDAGHGIGLVVPNTQSSTTVESRYGPLVLGGSPAADERARELAWPRLLRFLARL